MANGTNLKFTFCLAVTAGCLAGSTGLVVGGLALASEGPVICVNTLEATNTRGHPSKGGAAGPVEVTRCGHVQTAPQLMEQRFYSYTATFAQGVSLTNQITELFGIAMGGGDGTRVTGFGFPDQTIIWDGMAVGNTHQVLLQQQNASMPWRTADVSNGYSGSLGSSGAVTQSSYSPSEQGVW